MPFRPNYFDCAVTVSTLEFIEDLDAACREVKRVLKPNGFFIVVTPGYSQVVDSGLSILTGKSPKNDYSSRRQRLIPTLLDHFTVQQQLTVPPFGGSAVRLYTSLKLCPRI
jgi:ubiquinone/menaquinone biosynthesis C-methylase UbiE